MECDVAAVNNYQLLFFTFTLAVCKDEDTQWNISFRPFHETLWFHEIHVNYVERNPSRTVVSKMNSKKSLSVQFVTDRACIS